MNRLPHGFANSNLIIIRSGLLDTQFELTLQIAPRSSLDTGEILFLTSGDGSLDAHSIITLETVNLIIICLFVCMIYSIIKTILKAS